MPEGFHMALDKHTSEMALLSVLCVWHGMTSCHLDKCLKTRRRKTTVKKKTKRRRKRFSVVSTHYTHIHNSTQIQSIHCSTQMLKRKKKSTITWQDNNEQTDCQKIHSFPLLSKTTGVLTYLKLKNMECDFLSTYFCPSPEIKKGECG